MTRIAFLRSVLLLLLLIPAACAGKHIPPSDLPVETVKVNGVELGYRVLGQGPPLLMIMGYAGTMDVWDPVLVNELARSHTVVMFDNRGMGFSTADDTPLSMQLMASDAAGLLDALSIERADVLGWSMGSVITQELALNRPDKVRKIILYATAVDTAPVRAALDRMGKLSHDEFLAALFPPDWKKLHPDVYSRLPSPARPATPEAIGRQYTALVNWSGSRDRLPTLNVPALVIAGQDDKITPAAQNCAAAELIPGAWLVRFKGGGHWLMHQTPDQMARAAALFLNMDEDLTATP